MIELCPSCGTSIDMSGVAVFSEVACPACGEVMRARSDFNHFKILEVLGEGGMGAVYRAVDTNLGREVALKVLKISVAENPEEAGKLAVEARTTASINHPHVIRIYDFGQAQGQFYIAMELIGGGSLDDRIQGLGHVSETTALRVGIQIAEGLAAALEKGLIHRDLKPANILFQDEDTAKLVDFGLAVAMSNDPVSRAEIWGTPYYIAPEKLDEMPEDYRSDIYSLGGSLFHAMAGRPPYEAENASLVALKQLKSRPVSLQAFAPHVSNETAYVINRMMHKQPEQRYASYAELIEHLRYALERAEQRELDPDSARHETVQVGGGRHPLDLLWVVLPLLVLIAIGVVGYLYFFTGVLARD
jgi:eukaryotic-like serine/threonine-protein kinase